MNLVAFEVEKTVKKDTVVLKLTGALDTETRLHLAPYIDPLKSDPSLREVIFNLDLSGNRVEGQVDGKDFSAAQEVPLHRPIIESFVKMVRTGDRKQIRSDYADALKTLALTQAVDQAVVSGGMITLGR